MPQQTKSSATILPAWSSSSNDVSEGPDFKTLGECGYRVFTIYHVDVVAYVADIYFRGRIRPETTVQWYRRIGRPAARNG